LRLFTAVEHPEDAIDRLAGVDRVDGTQHEVPCFRCRKGDVHRGAVAHFTDEDDFRCLPQGRPEAIGKISEVGTEFTLVEGRTFVLMHELDRILQRHHVDSLSLVDFIQDCRKGRRLAAPGGAGDEDQAVLFPADILEDWRKPKRRE
jgi:hypothetical protein